jgi:3-oxoadipate enol-lactonase
MPAVTLELLAAAPSMEPEVALRRFVENALGDEPDSAIVERILHHRVTKLQDPAGWQAQAAAGMSFDPGPLQISVPTLVIHGNEDRVVDVRNARLLGERIPDAVVETMSGGHLMFWEDPRHVADLIETFLVNV